MKHANQLIAFILVVSFFLAFIPNVRAEDDGFSDGGEVTPYEPGPILNDPVDYSDDLVIDATDSIQTGTLLNSELRRKLEEDIDQL